MAESINTQSNLDLPLLLPDKGIIQFTEEHRLILCKPKLMPLKSVTLEKLEKMQKEAEEKLMQQQKESGEN